jgi:hypothetical protein
MTQHGPDHQPTSHHPRYHSAREDDGPAGTTRQAVRQRRMRALIIAIVIALLLAIVIMHATGAMPRGTGI